MNIFRTQTELSAAIRELADVRDELRSGSKSWIARQYNRCRWFFIKLRVQKLADQLHSHSR